jgi:hypothetical protein
MAHNGKEERFDIFEFPWQSFEQQLEDDDAHRPDVTLVSIEVFG